MRRQSSLAVLLVGAFVALGAADAAARTWSGQVVCATTGRPVSGANVRAGNHQFTEIGGLRTTTGADGRFRLTWSEENWTRHHGDTTNHYLRVDSPLRALGHGRSGDPQYWSARLIRTAPSEAVVVRVVPFYVRIKGRLLSAEDGTPLRNTGVQLASDWNPPGGPIKGTAHIARTDERGEFAFNPWRAFPSRAFPGLEPFPPIHDIPAGVSPRSDREDFGNLVRRPAEIFKFGVEKDGVFYPIPPEMVAPGLDDTVYTYVTIRHPATDRPPHSQPITAELRGVPEAPPTAPAPPSAPGEPTRPSGFTVEAAKRNVPQGGSVTVPVSLNNVDALANMNVNIHYDPSVIRPARNAARGNIIPQSLFEANVRDRGVVRLGFAQREDIRGTGTLAQIPFEAVGRAGARSALRVEVTMAATSAGGRVTPAQLIHGEVVVVGADGRVPGDTTGRGTLTAADAMNALKMSVGNMPVDMNADIDEDGRVTARDATLILQRVVGR